MQFDKLYNLILESILTEDIQSKIKKAISTLIKSGQLKDQDDPKAQLVKTIIKRNNSIDVNGKTKLDQLLKTNQKYTTRAEVAKDNYLDSIKQLYQKQEYKNEIVVYKVQQSKAGMNAVRKIVDAQWGEDANPWCLISRKEGSLDSAWDFWNQYDEWPKQIAFQNNQLLAFRASDDQEIDYWWNRKDKKSRRLRLKDGSLFQIPKPQWTSEELKKRQLNKIEAFKSKFTYNEKTGRYDIKDNVYIKEQYIVNGDLPFPFGVINGNFNLFDAGHLITSIKNLPTKVLGKLFFHKENKLLLNSQLCKDYMKNLLKVFIKTNNLIYNQQTGRYDCDGNLIIDEYYLKNGQFPVPLGVIKGNFNCTSSNKLTSLQNGPTEVKGDFYCRYCLNLKSLKGAPKEVDGEFSIGECHYLTSLIGSPKRVGSFDCGSCSHIKSLKGITPHIDGDINISSCGITKLEYLPKIVNGNFYCSGNSKLKSLEGSPEVVKGNFKCGFTKISSFLGGPKIVEGNIECWQCDDLVSLNGLPQKVTGNVSCLFCDKLKVTEQDRKKYKING